MQCSVFRYSAVHSRVVSDVTCNHGSNTSSTTSNNSSSNKQ